MSYILLSPTCANIVDDATDFPSSSSLKWNPQQAVCPSSVLSAETESRIKFLVLYSSISLVMAEETNLDPITGVCIPAQSLLCESSNHHRSKVGMSFSLFNFFVTRVRDEERKEMEKSDGWIGPLLLLGVKGLELIRAVSGVWVKSHT